jgi:hypothetical protein
MRPNILIISTLFFALNTYAESMLSSANLVAGPELQDVSRVPESAQPGGFKYARLASARYGICSGTFISRHGHLLTNLHCLHVIYGETLPGSGVTILETSPASHPQYASEIKSTARMAHVSYFDPISNAEQSWTGANARAIVLGDGFAPTIDPVALAIQYPDQLRKIAKGGYLNAGDFAIIDTGMANSPCVQVSQSNAKPGEQIYSIGYPPRDDWQKIQGRPNWTGTEAALSVGEIVDGLNDSLWGQRGLNATPKLDPASLSTLTEALKSPLAFYSTLDAFHGSSGSGVFNTRGELVAVVNSTIDYMTSAYEPGSVSGVNIEHILEESKSQLDSETFNKVFDCSAN